MQKLRIEPTPTGRFAFASSLYAVPLTLKTLSMSLLPCVSGSVQLLTVVYFLDSRTQSSFRNTLDWSPAAPYASLASTYGPALCTPTVLYPPPPPPTKSDASLLNAVTGNLGMVIGGGIGGGVILLLVYAYMYHLGSRWRTVPMQVRLETEVSWVATELPCPQATRAIPLYPVSNACVS